jgi:hypothetical protein
MILAAAAVVNISSSYMYAKNRDVLQSFNLFAAGSGLGWPGSKTAI